MSKPYYETEEYSEAENELDTYDDKVKLVMEYRISEKHKDQQIAELKEQLADKKREYEVLKILFDIVNNPEKDAMLKQIQGLQKKLDVKCQQIKKLQNQLEEKEKDNQFLKKMYLSEKQKNDNYHTEKYGLDKPVEELRKIKLNPKEKEIYYKGFDNCERQFATHIAELQQQLKAQPAEIVEKIRKWGQKHYNWVGDGTGYDGQDYNECIGFNRAIDQLNEALGTILKWYGGKYERK